MLFSSWPFIAVFLPIVFLCFRVLQARAWFELSLLWLVAASLFFYGWFKPAYLLIIAVSTVINYFLGLVLSRTRSQPLLVVGLAANLSALIYYKYAGLFLTTLNQFGADFEISSIILPLGISFFTFQKIAWLVDSWRGETKETNFLHFALFVTFFPQLIAGPIVHHKEMIPQFLKKLDREVLNGLAAAGVSLFIIGLFKKVIVADYMDEIADPVFSAVAAGHMLTALEAWLGAVAYTLQVYFDFSGYSDMAIGLGAMFGVRLPLNFLSPYQAQDIVQFWRRWHISLSKFLRDYLYIPLGGNRRGTMRRYCNLMITMALGGLWHGANWTFAIWGILHGFYLTLCHAWKSYSRWRMPRAIGRALTFFAVLLAWVFFRSETVDGALRFVQDMMGLHGWTVTPMSASRILRINEKWYLLIASLLTALFAPSAHAVMQKRLALDITGVSEDQPVPRSIWAPTRKWAMLMGLMLALSMTMLTRVNAFIYFQF